MNGERLKVPGAGRRTNKVVVDTFILGAIFLFLAVMLALALQMGRAAGQVPRLVAAAALILCVIQFFAQVGKLRAGVREPVASPGGGQTLQWYWNLLLIAVFIVSLMLLGFLVSTFLYLLLVPSLMGYRKWKVTVVLAIVATVVLYYSFGTFFHVRLPAGLLVGNIFS